MISGTCKRSFELPPAERKNVVGLYLVEPDPGFLLRKNDASGGDGNSDDLGSASVGGGGGPGMSSVTMAARTIP